MRGDKKRWPEFGKRGLEQIKPTEPIEPKLSAIERLKQAGLWWWSPKAPSKAATGPRSKTVRREA